MSRWSAQGHSWRHFLYPNSLKGNISLINCPIALKRCSLDLIHICSSCEWGQIMTRHEFLEARCSRKGQKYTLLLDGGLVKGYPLRIWVIIDIASRQRRLGCPVIMILKQSAESLDGVSLPPITNNGKVGNLVLCLHSRCFGSCFNVIFFMYLASSGFSFKPIATSS